MHITCEYSKIYLLAMEVHVCVPSAYMVHTSIYQSCYFVVFFCTIHVIVYVNNITTRELQNLFSCIICSSLDILIEIGVCWVVLSLIVLSIPGACLLAVKTIHICHNISILVNTCNSCQSEIAHSIMEKLSRYNHGHGIRHARIH